MPKFISTPLIGLTYTLIVAAWQESQLPNVDPLYPY